MAKKITIILTDAAYLQIQQVAAAASLEAPDFVGQKLKAAVAQGLYNAATAQITQQVAAIPTPAVTVEDVA